MKKHEIDYKKKLLESNKIRFLLAIKKSAEKLKVQMPQVEFWKDYDLHFGVGERAHIHIESNTICIPEPELQKMSYEEIRATAAHEVSHLYYPNHGGKFQSTQSETETGIWEPPAGIPVISDGEKETAEEKPKKERVVKAYCNYHLCKKKEKTFQCKYCKSYFCRKHKTPLDMPTLRVSSEDEKENIHPCWAYTHYLEEKEKEEKEAYGKALDKLVNKSKTSNRRIIDIGDEGVEYSTLTPDDYEQEEEEPKQKTKRPSKSPFNLKSFLRKYIYFRVPREVKPHLNQFLLIFIIGFILDYVYYQTFSLYQLFIGGALQWFSVLMPVLKYGLGGGYDIFYLIINGIYYAYFYYAFVLVVFSILTNLEDKDTWIMLVWFTAIVYLAIRFFPQII